MSFERTLVGKIAQVSSSNGAYIYKEPFGKKMLEKLFPKGFAVGIFTGVTKIFTKNGKTYRFAKVWTIDKQTSKVKAWVDMNYIQETNATAFNDGNVTLQSMIVTDQYTYLRLLQTYKYFLALKKAGKKIPLQEFGEMIQIYLRLMKRQSKIMSLAGVEVKTGFPASMASLRNSWEKTLRDALADKTSGIGILPVILIIFWIGVGAAFTYGVYQLIKPDYEDSKSDFVLSDDLEAKLKKYLPKEVYNQLQEEGEQNVDDAYNAGKTSQKWKDIWGFVKLPVLFLGGFFVVDRFIMKQSQKRRAE